MSTLVPAQSSATASATGAAKVPVKEKPRRGLSRLRYTLSLLRSIFITDLLIYLYTAVMGTLSLLGSVVDSAGRWQHWCARTWSWMILKTSRISVHVEGGEHVQAARPTIYCSNHPSAMDIPIMFVHLPVQFRFLAKKVLFHLPFLGWHLRRSGHIPVEREQPKAAMKSFEEAVKKIHAGSSVLLFPEGSRSRDGSLGRFKRGGFFLALQAGAPIVPITLNGSREVLPTGSYHIRPGRVEMVIHPPIATEGLTAKDLSALSERVRERIRSRFRLPNETIHGETGHSETGHSETGHSETGPGETASQKTSKA